MEPRAESTSKPVDAVFGHYELPNNAPPARPSALITRISSRCNATFVANSSLALMHVSKRSRTASVVTERSDGAHRRRKSENPAAATVHVT